MSDSWDDEFRRVRPVLEERIKYREVKAIQRLTPRVSQVDAFEIDTELDEILTETFWCGFTCFDARMVDRWKPEL